MFLMEIHFFVATFEEALELEKMYSNHRNSDSFREEIARKKLKRDHPVNENRDLFEPLDVNDIINEIDSNKGNA